MDLKTLEYMEQRVNQGKKLVGRIEDLKKRINLVKGNQLKCIELYVGSDKFRTSVWGDKPVSEYQAHVEAGMINAFIDVTGAEIKRLEHELAEL